MSGEVRKIGENVFMTKPAAVIFDVDGTLTDTEAAWDEVRRSLATADGVPWPQTATTDMMGMSTPEWARYLVEVVGVKGTPEDAARRTIDGMVGHYAKGVTILPGAVDAVHRMADWVPIAFASSSPPVLIGKAAELLQIADRLGAVVSTEEVAAGKPAPDGFLEAARRLNVTPAECVVIEDSPNGIRSGLAAGMKVIAVPPSFHPPARELLDRCDAVISTLDELTIELVEGLM